MESVCTQREAPIIINAVAAVAAKKRVELFAPGEGCHRLGHPLGQPFFAVQIWLFEAVKVANSASSIDGRPKAMAKRGRRNSLIS